MSKWKPGDIVCLKTGGWPMTVEAYCTDQLGDDSGHTETRQTQNVQCVWFERRPTGLSGAALAGSSVFTWDGPKYGSFHEDALEATEPAK